MSLEQQLPKVISGTSQQKIIFHSLPFLIFFGGGGRERGENLGRHHFHSFLFLLSSFPHPPATSSFAKNTVLFPFPLFFLTFDMDCRKIADYTERTLSIAFAVY